MATVSFALLDQTFYITDNANVVYSAGDSLAPGASYSYLSTVSHAWDFYGTGLTATGGLLDGGTVTKVEVDLDDDTDDSFFEISISGLSVPAATFGIGVGTTVQQLAAFWTAALGGNDTLDFTLASYAIDLQFAGDGAYLIDGSEHFGGDDSFNDGGTALAGSSELAGDYMYVSSADAAGGDDTFSVGAPNLYGDFYYLEALWTGIGGNDVIAPARLADNSLAVFRAVGDSYVSLGTLTGGDDLIDLRMTDLTGFTQDIFLYGDVYANDSSGSLAGGDDTIHGSSRGDRVYGDYGSNSGAVTGGADLIYGYAGDDAVFCQEGDDSVYGGSENDFVLAGAGADLLSGDDGSDMLFGEEGNDTVLGGAGFDSLLGEDGNDVIRGGSVADTIGGGPGDDNIAGQGGLDTLVGDAGADTMRGNTGRDFLDGGADADQLAGRSGADTLDGGDGNDFLTGKGGADRYIYSVGGDQDTIRTFAPGIGVGDVIHIAGFGPAFDSLTELMLAATDNGADTTIDFGGGDVLVIKGVVVSQLASDDFTFG